MAELKIVIAEDNPLMMELLSSILEEEDGFLVVGKADNGEDAYQMIMEKNPDLVLLDVIMPKLDGISVLEKVRAARSGKNMPAVIIVSAAGNETVASAAFRNGASYYILKPFDREILLDKIHLVAEERIRTKTVSVVREKPAETYFAKGDYIRQNLEDDVTQLLHEIGIRRISRAISICGMPSSFRWKKRKCWCRLPRYCILPLPRSMAPPQAVWNEPFVMRSRWRGAADSWR